MVGEAADGARELARQMAEAASSRLVASVSGPPLDEALLDPLERWLQAVPTDDRTFAHALGKALVEAGCIDPEVLSAIIPVMARFLAGVDVDESRRHACLGAVASAYAAALRERTLQHQEQLYQALRQSRDTARMELAEETRFVNAILDHMDALVIVSTIDETVTRFNKAAERLTGYTVEDLNRGEGRPIVGEESIPAMQRAIDKLIIGPPNATAVPLRTKLHARSGAVYDVTWMVSLLYDDSGNPTHYVGTGIDITGQLQIEAELQEARQKLAEREQILQQRLARALHDGPVQELLSLGVTIAEMQTRAEADQTWTARERLEEVIPGLEMVRRELLAVASGLRQLMAELRPPGLEEIGLYQALEAYLQSERVREQPLAVSLAINGDVDSLEAGLRTTLFFIVREALRNVQRHAGATEAEVIVSRDTSQVSVAIRDNGRGFEVPERLASLVRQHQFGLIGLQERVQLRGGTVKIDSGPGSGTVVRAVLPVPL